MEGVPATLGILSIKVDRRVLNEGSDEFMGVWVGRRGGSEKDCKPSMIAAVDFGSSKMRIVVP
jgi:hypothetical protein